MILGIDPGLHGALALIDPPNPSLPHVGGSITVLDIPTHKITVNGSKKHTIDLYQLGNWLDIHRNRIRLAVIEQVGAMPKQGVTSSFNFGFTAGAIQGAVAANQIPTMLVRPNIWKRALGLLGQDKDASRAAASRLFPQHAHLWARAKDDGRAEAVLLAHYGSQL